MNDGSEKIYELQWLLSNLDMLKYSDNNSYEHRKRNPNIDFPHYFRDLFLNVTQLDVNFPKANFESYWTAKTVLRNDPCAKYPQSKPYPSMLDYLPGETRDKIFSYCNGKDLMKLSQVYPQYTKAIMRPVFWKKYLRYHFDEHLFSVDEIKILINYMKGNIGYFSFSQWNNFDIEFYKEFINDNSNSLEALCIKNKPDEVYEHLNKCHKLKHLIIENDKKINGDKILLNISKYAKLETLRLTNSNLNCETLDCFFSNANIHFLKSLDLSQNDARDSTLKLLAERCPHLKLLILSKNLNFTEIGLEEVLRRCNYIYKLDVSHNHNVSPYLYRRLPKKKLNLKIINFSMCNQAEFDDVEAVFKNYLKSKKVYRVYNRWGKFLSKVKYKGFYDPQSFIEMLFTATHVDKGDSTILNLSD